MVKKLEPIVDEVIEEPVEQETKYPKLKDKSVNDPEPQVITVDEQEQISKICPHYYDLKKRYAEYTNYDDDGKNPLPLRIDRVHQLSAFEATIAQADLSKELIATPTRLIKAFDYSKSNERQTYLIIDKRVVGIDRQGRSTNISSIRVGKFKYPTQFEQDQDGDWTPINNKLETIYSIPFDKDIVLEHAHNGNPFIKKYVVWHPDGMRRGHFTLEEFINLTDEEQISLIDQGKR